MYPVSQSYKDAISAETVLDKIVGTITLKDDTTINITDEHIEGGSLYFSEQCVSGDSLDVGGVIASEMGLTLMSYQNPYALDGARINLNYGLMTGSDSWEYVPFGIYYVTPEIERELSAVTLKALDGLILFDVDISGVSTSGTPRTIILSCCAKAGVLLSTSAGQFESFPNYDLMLALPESNDQIKTCRDMLMWACQIMGCFARMNRSGNLEIIPVKIATSVKNISIDERFQSKVSDFNLQITGITIKNGETDYMQGSDDLILALEENPLLPVGNDIDVILSNLLTQISEVQYKPFSCDFIGDPSLQAGDYVTLTDIADVGDVDALITTSTWHYRGDHTIEGAGKASRNVKSQENKAVSAIKAAVGNVLAVAKSLGASTDLIKNALGGHVLIRENEGTNEILIMDDKDPTAARKIWRWNLGGLGFSDNVIGADNPAREYIVAMTMDGAINAQFIRAGLLSSLNGYFVLDLETGSIISEAGLTLTDSTSGLVTRLGSGAWEIKNALTSEIIAKFTKDGALMPTAIIEKQMYLGNAKFTAYTRGTTRGIMVTVDEGVS